MTRIPDSVAEEPLFRHFLLSVEGVRSDSELKVVEAYIALARGICVGLPKSDERTVALRKLLESRDAAMRAVDDEIENGRKKWLRDGPFSW